MTSSPDALTPYEIGYLFGGPDRVAVVALTALHADGRIKVSPDRHRVYAERRTADDPVEAAALEIVPDVGRVLGLTRLMLATSPAVAEVGARLRAEGLLPGSRLGALRRRGRAQALRRELAESPEGLARVAVLGPEGIADDELREIFATHEYAPPKHVKPLKGPYTGSPVDPLYSNNAPDRAREYGGAFDYGPW